MPQRFLRPAIRNSERWNTVDWKCQSFWVRLLTLVDDFGRFDGRISVLHGECFSVWNEKNPTLAINPQETAALCTQLSEARLVEFYESQGRKVLQLTQWEERPRSEKSKWPDHENICSHDANIPLRNPAESCGILPPSPSPQSSSSSSPSPSPPPEGVGVFSENETGNGELDPVFVKDLLAAYRRPADSRLTFSEQSALAGILRENPRYRDEWDMIIVLRQKEPRYFPQSLSRLLNTWQETLDRAMNWAPDPKQPKTIADRLMKELDSIR